MKKRRGNPAHNWPRADTLGSRFWAKVDIRAEKECWHWTATLDHIGRGRINVPGHTLFASRASYLLNKGLIPKGLVVRHTCDNPTCVNPGHLILGTQADNVHDAVARGRVRRGEAHQNSKLTAEQVRRIRAISKRGEATKLAQEFGVSVSAVGRIRRGEIWTHMNA